MVSQTLTLTPSATAKRTIKYIVKNPSDKIAEYMSVFASMEKEFEREVFEGTYVVATLILTEVEKLRKSFSDYQSIIPATCHLRVTSDVNHELEKLTIADGASLVVSNDKQCLQGTRIDILSKTINWADNFLAEDQSQRILLLTGLAGSGKSTIARTIASRFHANKRPGASFSFSRDVKSRHINQLVPHIARQLADIGDVVKTALAKVIPSYVLHASTDLRMQFTQLLVEVLKDMTIAGPIVIVIDAIDEASDGSYEGVERLKELISVITDPMLALPSNIRIIVTSRPEKAILDGVKDCITVLHEDMGGISRESADNDISRYVQRLLSPTGINEQYCRRIALMSEGLFQFASVACKEILNPRGPPPETQCRRIIDSGAKGLDKLYENVLEDHFDMDCLTDFVSVMSFILALQEPVSASTLRRLWQAAENNVAVLNNVLEKMRSLLDGIDDATKNIQPSHTSFRDFLADDKRSQSFFVLAAASQKAQENLVHACLRIMGEQLSFNMCKIETSYKLNKNVQDLDDRISQYIRAECLYACQHWADHLQHTQGAQEDPGFQDGLSVVLTQKLLFWLEVLSVLGKMSIAPPSMSVLTIHLTVCAPAHSDALYANQSLTSRKPT